MMFPKTKKELEIYWKLKELEDARNRYLNPPTYPNISYQLMQTYSRIENEYLELVNQ